ncbi:YqgE/AlgH family protein [Solitalea lacus]|uniref:YqgE/AlgH family protein n=1 Tax=Solitalea lacus TaxID=2911172 RepID=UPI001EDA961E|nr:YqgE/AlgH family protein [Solitalea lacus]UKJ06256.1 YqgE/AlgH family protein [Solitalea lacus]
MLNLIKPTAGKMLISEPFMSDPNFKRSVVYLTEHNEQGSVGFVLNQKTELTLNNLVDDIEEADFPVYIGGPVGNDSLHYIHTINDLDGCVSVDNGIYWGGNFELLKILIQAGKVERNEIRFFIGYSGWGETQLQDELDENAWLVAETNKDFLFGESNERELWAHAVKSLGEKFAMIINFPENPRFN